MITFAISALVIFAFAVAALGFMAGCWLTGRQARRAMRSSAQAVYTATHQKGTP